MRGKNVRPDDVNFNERFLLYSGQDGRLMVFSADTELATLYKSEYIIADGTSELYRTSVQLIIFKIQCMHARCE